MQQDNKNEIKISVIIPVYNVEPWIGECIESLKKQKQDGLEFIFVDDCGTDNSMKIVESWAAEDNRVRLIRNESNKGEGASRNAGIEAARGRYINNIDPDDRVSDDFYETLYTKAMESGCDIVKGARAEFEDGKALGEVELIKPISKLNSLIMGRREKGLPLYELFTYEHTTAIYKADLLMDNNIRYGNSRNSGDVTFLLKVCKYTESIAVTEDAVYYYRQRTGAATSEYTMSRAWNELEALDETVSYLKIIKEEGSSSIYLKDRIRNYLSNYYYAIRAEDVPEPVREEYHNCLKSIIGRLGFTPALFEGFAELEVFLNYETIIPYYKIKNGKEFYDGIERWTEFFEVQGRNIKEIHYKGYASSLYRSLCWTFKYGPRKRYLSILIYDRFYRSMFARLSRGDKNKILRLFATSEKRHRLLCDDKTDPKVSVVIPVYNAEKYIARCIESLREQTLTEIEFIFVDDCSPDGSMAPIYEWASFDSRVRILRNDTNLGEGGSRNRGMEAARGIYVNTIDPDDWVSCDFYELLYAKAAKTGADIVKGTRIKIRDKSYDEHLPQSNLNEKIELSLTAGRPLYRILTYEHQTVLFKRKLLSERTKYGKSANACDTMFLLSLCSEADSFALEKEARYYYLQRDGSATGDYSLRRSRNELISFREQIDFIIQREMTDKNACAYCLKHYRTYSSRLCHAIKSEHIALQAIEECISELKECVRLISPLLHLYGSVPEIEALSEDNCLLASELCEDPAISSEEIQDWICYISTQKNKKRKPMNRRLASLMATYTIMLKDARNASKDAADSLSKPGEELKKLRRSDRAFIRLKRLYYMTRRNLIKRALRQNDRTSTYANIRK